MFIQNSKVEISIDTSTKFCMTISSSSIARQENTRNGLRKTIQTVSSKEKRRESRTRKGNTYLGWCVSHLLTSENSWFEIPSIDMTSFLSKFNISSMISVVLVPNLYDSATLLVPAEGIIGDLLICQAYIILNHFFFLLLIKNLGHW